MRVQTISSLRNPGHLMRAGMNILTTQVNSLRDYCGVITGHPGPHPGYLYQQQQQQQQQYHDLRYSPGPISHIRRHPITTINEDDESMLESTSMMNTLNQTPYAGFTASNVVLNASGIGQLDAADNSVRLALNNFHHERTNSMLDIAYSNGTRGQMSGGIGLFQGHNQDHDDDLVSEPERLIIYGEQRPMC